MSTPLVQRRIGIALRFGCAVDGAQAVQLSASARVIAARDFTGTAAERGVIKCEHDLAPPLIIQASALRQSTS